MNWDITVLTIKENLYPPSMPIDNTLSLKVPETVKIWKTNILPIFPFNIPDSSINWFFPAVKTGKKIIKMIDPDIIYSSAPPWTSHLIGCNLKKWSNKPLIVDFRDPWAQAPFKQKSWNKIEKKIHNRLESYVVKEADAIIVNNEWTRKDLLKHHAFIENKLHVINNGFDIEDYKDIFVNNSKNEKFIITHAGNLYGGRDPSPFLEAIKGLIEEGRLISNETKVQFVGIKENPFGIRDKVRMLKLEDVVEILPSIPHKECLNILASSTVLLIFQGGTHLSIPSKLYEYMAIGKPILALTGEGATRDLIIQERLGKVVEAYDPSEIKNSLIELYQEWKIQETKSSEERIIPERYEAQYLTLQFHNMLNDILTKK